MERILRASVGEGLKFFSRWKKLCMSGMVEESLRVRGIAPKYVCIFCGHVVQIPDETVYRVINCPTIRGPGRNEVRQVCATLEKQINQSILDDPDLLHRNAENRLQGTFCTECNGFGCYWCIVHAKRPRRPKVL